MKFKQATSANVAQDRAKMSPKVIAEIEKREKEEEKDIPVKPKATAAYTVDEMKVIKANTAKLAEAIISVNLRLEPHLNAEILCTLYPGVKVKVNDSDEPDWYSLTYQGRDCFVMKQYIKLI